MARAAVAAALAGLVGCGGAGGSTRSDTGAAPPAAARPLSATQLRTQVAGAFRQGLYRMAVMDQPSDDAADLGQELPTGRVRTVDCSPDRAAAPRPGVRVSACVVRWEHVDGAPARTRLLVSEDRRGCWNATPRPAFPTRYDATIASYSEHPLNVLSAVRRGC